MIWAADNGRADQSLAEHAAIVTAIGARDAEAAERAMRVHLTNVARALHERAIADDEEQVALEVGA